MKTNQWRKGNWESGAMGASHSASLALALLFISAIPPGASVFLDLSTTDNDKLLNQIDTACSSFLREEQPLRTLDSLWDLCNWMQGVLPKSQEPESQKTTKRSGVFHPLLQLIQELHSRRRRRITPHENPRIIQSRGYFLYRPRNGRRSTEYA